ncbi:outer membrane beta-barrel protein [Rhodocytophaga aerolata]|uniref:Outer membrane beta-barrel protein n=1 Tax=Rhodocytophaga aerolata TaxID=455078 RepID=A0ABT8R1X1_9BACT|nr:outer membrane beta-barrel protein [Rhodocytophaga aerolata]MDO1445243.1 outer membrane beta-barrel protein [Rhodocytophaga aerolata]
MRNLLLVFILLLTFQQVYSQKVDVYGSVQQASDKTNLPGAAVILQQIADSSTKGIVTDLNGKFKFEQVVPGKYLIKVSYLGFAPFSKPIVVGESALNVGILALQEEATALQEIEIIGQTLAGEQKGDTSQFNAGAFKTAPDASAQDLVQKMPGIAMQDGKLQAQGQDVQQILVDGKPFFGDDVNTALQNLPSEVIESIQVFDQKSDRAQMGGFDDGERIKTINIITKPSRKTGQFGRVSAGYGTNERYLFGGSVNLFSGNRRVTITGLSNNINTLNFSADPNNQGEERQQNGIIKTNLVGINYSELWGKKIEASGSYFYTQRQNQGVQTRFRDFILSSDSGQVYSEENRTLADEASHRFNMRLDYKINDRNRILVRPNVSIQQLGNESYFFGNTVTDNGPLNQTENTSNADNTNINFNNNIFYSHNFTKKGRGVMLRLNTGYNSGIGDSYRLANNVFFTNQADNTILNQYTNLNRTGFTWEAEASVREGIGKNGQVEIEYEIGNRVNDSDKRTFDFSEQYLDYRLLNIPLSNTFRSEYLTQETEVGYQYNTKKIRFEVEASYQHAQLKNDQLFPKEYTMDRTFKSILPSVELNYKFSQSKNLEFDYRTWTNEPSVSQLQDVIDNSNPLQLRSGNPNLNQSYHNWLRGRYRSHNTETNRSVFVSVESEIINNYISNSTFIADQPTILEEGIELQRGSQLTRPVNLDGYWSVRSFASYGQPIGFIKSNFNVRGSVNFSRRPGMINEEINLANTNNFRLGMSISSNISEKLDFTLSTRSSYNIVRNSLRPALNNNFFNQSSRARLSWIIWEGIVFRTDLNHQVNTGLSAGYDNNYLLWNMSIGKKLFKNQRGEVSLNVYDLLKQNISINRNVTELYVEDVQSNVLQQYFMLTFTYNIRRFSTGASAKDFGNNSDEERNDRNGRNRN